MHAYRVEDSDVLAAMPRLAEGPFNTTALHDLRDACRSVLHQHYLTIVHQPITHILVPALVPAMAFFMETVWRFWGPATHANDPAAVDIAARSCRSAAAVWTEGLHALPPADYRDPIVQAVHRAITGGDQTIGALAQLCHPAIAEPLTEGYDDYTHFVAAAAASGNAQPADAILRSVATMLAEVAAELDDHQGGDHQAVVLTLAAPIRCRQVRQCRQLANGAQLVVPHPPFDEKISVDPN